MKRFRLRFDDTVSARLYTEAGDLLATLYDSGFTSIGQVQSALVRKVLNYSGKSLRVSIRNIDKEEYKDYSFKTNNIY